MEHIEKMLSTYPRVTLTRKPTPLDHLPTLSNQMGLEIYIKRDDLTDLTLGGDKPRKLEYELAMALENQADIIVTVGSSQSNHARLTTAAAKKLGLDCAVVLSRDAYTQMQGNLLTVHLLGAEVHIIRTEDHWDLAQHAEKVIAELRAAGRRPHFIPVSGTTPRSCLGYVSGALEMIEQLKQMDVTPDAVYTPFGTGGIFTAMLLTFREAGIDCPFVGVSVNRAEEACQINLDQWWHALCDLLEINPGRPRGPYELTDQYIGAEYGDPTPACLDAIMAVGAAEGVLLDPVYSGKVMSGLRDHQARNKWPDGSRILFVHSGGVPALFAYHSAIEQHLQTYGISI